MKLLRNSYREILFFFYYSLVCLLPVLTVVRLLHTLPHQNLLGERALVAFAFLIALFLTLIVVVVFYTFLSAILQLRSQTVESFYR